VSFENPKDCESVLTFDSFMYSNIYGVEGPKKLIQILKTEILADAAQIGINDLHNIPAKVVSLLLHDEQEYG
jgi:hypothetical protein